MVVRTGAATGTVPAPPAAVFDAITDIDRLPEWNKTIRRVVERRDVLTEGAEWVVAVKPPGMPEWLSRSETVEHDPVGHRFRYRACTDDGNPSWAIWEWQAEPAGSGSTVTVPDPSERSIEAVKPRCDVAASNTARDEEAARATSIGHAVLDRPAGPDVTYRARRYRARVRGRCTGSVTADLAQRGRCRASAGAVHGRVGAFEKVRQRGVATNSPRLLTPVVAARLAFDLSEVVG